MSIFFSDRSVCGSSEHECTSSVITMAPPSSHHIPPPSHSRIPRPASSAAASNAAASNAAASSVAPTRSSSQHRGLAAKLHGLLSNDINNSGEEDSDSLPATPPPHKVNIYTTPTNAIAM